MTLNLAVLALAGIFLSSCDNAVDVDEALVEAEVEPTPVAYYEYLRCKRGENWTMESAQSFVADWNAELDGMENTLDSAFVYVPKNSENQNFDTVWVLRFPDKAAMEKGWSTYQESGADDRLQSMHPGVVECGNEVAENRFGFDMYSAVSTPDGFGDEEPYLVQGQFCNFNDGKGPEDLTRVIRDHFVPEIEQEEQMEAIQATGSWSALLISSVRIALTSSGWIISQTLRRWKKKPASISAAKRVIPYKPCSTRFPNALIKTSPMASFTKT